MEGDWVAPVLTVTRLRMRTHLLGNARMRIGAGYRTGIRLAVPTWAHTASRWIWPH